MCCFKFLKKKKYSKIKETKKVQSLAIYSLERKYNNSIYNDTCNCEKQGPPVIGTCDVCGAWKVY